VRASLAVAVAVASLAAGCGESSGVTRVGPTLSQATPAVAKRLLKQRLDAKQLTYNWVACVAVGLNYRHVPITRCNVDFGIDPHVEGYCVLLKDGRLATNHEDASIPCKHDDAGWDRTTVTSG
jgi:hypothetical protein